MPSTRNKRSSAKPQAAHGKASKQAPKGLPLRRVVEALKYYAAGNWDFGDRAKAALENS